MPIRLKKDLPEELVKFLIDCINLKFEDGNWKPDHKLFTLERWGHLFVPHACFDDVPYFKKLDNGYYELYIHSDINHAWEEVNEFERWIAPYVAGRKKKQYIGWHKGEEWYDSKINMYVNR